MEKTNFEELKELVKSFIEAGEAIAALMDGYQHEDLNDLIEAATTLPEGLEGINKGFEALKDLSDEQRAELNEYIVEEFDMDSDEEDVEAFIEEMLDWGLHTVQVGTKTIPDFINRDKE